MAYSLRCNSASLTPFLSPKPQKARLSANQSFISIRCGRRDNRGPLVKGRILSSEAIQAIQSLKRAYRKSSSSSPADATLPSLSRLIKSDLLATLRELLRQEQCVLALHVFSTIRSEYPPPDLALYADMVVALARNRLMDEIDGLIDPMEEINCDDEKGLVRLMKGVIGAQRKESTVRIFELMKKSGVGSDKQVGEYVVKVLSRGLRNFGEESMAEEVEKEFCVPIRVPISISRVNQFDAARLDIEMSAMLKEQLVRVFSVIKPGMLFQYEAELDALLEFLIWRFSIWVDKPTPGNGLMNLRYRDERAIETRGKGLEGPGLTVAQKIWYCIATVGGQYLWACLQSFSAFRRWGDSEQRPLAHQAWGLIQHIEGLCRAASFGNLLIFLYTGSYRNLIERALRARLVYGSPNMNRAVSFEYMNCQLVSNEFLEMLLLLLPLLNSPTIKNLLRPFSTDKSLGSLENNSSSPICQTSPTIPYLALPCQHSYCYYCLRTRCAVAPSFQCSRCSEPVVAMRRHGGSGVSKTDTQ